MTPGRDGREGFKVGWLPVGVGSLDTPPEEEGGSLLVVGAMDEAE